MPSKRKPNLGRITNRARAAKIRRIQESEEDAAARRLAQNQRQAALRKMATPGIPGKPQPTPRKEVKQEESSKVAEPKKKTETRQSKDAKKPIVSGKIKKKSKPKT